jgi:hypothetical protein
MNDIIWLQDWYSKQCNGDWEHTYKILITTLDNPGWRVEIDLENTVYESLSIKHKTKDSSETDWYTIEIKDKKFIGNGDPTKLETIIKEFRELILGFV